MPVGWIEPKARVFEPRAHVFNQKAHVFEVKARVFELKARVFILKACVFILKACGFILKARVFIPKARAFIPKARAFELKARAFVMPTCLQNSSPAAMSNFIGHPCRLLYAFCALRGSFDLFFVLPSCLRVFVAPATSQQSSQHAPRSRDAGFRGGGLGGGRWRPDLHRGQ